MSVFLSRLALAVVPALIALACVVVASGFLIAAFYFYLLALPASPELAALIVGLVLLALAVLVIITARILVAYRQRRAGEAVAGGLTEGGIASLASRLGGQAAREATATADAHPYYTFCAAFLAGLTVGGTRAGRSFVEAALRASEHSERARGR